MTPPRENSRGKNRKFTNPCYLGGEGGYPLLVKDQYISGFSFESKNKVMENISGENGTYQLKKQRSLLSFFKGK